MYCMHVYIEEVKLLRIPAEPSMACFGISINRHMISESPHFFNKTPPSLPPHLPVPSPPSLYISQGLSHLCGVVMHIISPCFEWYIEPANEPHLVCKSPCLCVCFLCVCVCVCGQTDDNFSSSYSVCVHGGGWVGVEVGVGGGGGGGWKGGVCVLCHGGRACVRRG